MLTARRAGSPNEVYVVVEATIAQLLDALPELEPATPAGRLVRHQGPFHRALAAVPVVFRPHRH